MSEARQTSIKYLARGQDETSQGYLWACHRPGGDTLSRWHTGRGCDRLETILPADFMGTIQHDAFAACPTDAR